MGGIVFLGPQRLKRTLRYAVEDLGVRGPIAVVSAGWQEREAETEEMAAHLDRPIVNLSLHARTEDVLEHDLELFVAHRERTAILIQLHDLYRLQLARAKETARELLRREGESALLEPDRSAAIEAVRRIDEQHLLRIDEVNDEFRQQWNTAERERVIHHRREIATILEDCEAIAIAGGHVGVLRNRLRLFDIAGLVGERSVVAWSAGAMCLSERIVLFHDSPPQGPGDAEVLSEGLGLLPGVLPFPHARRRLRLDDPVRVALLARRFRPLRCLALDEGSRWLVRPGRPPEARAVREMLPDGRVVEAGAA